MGPVPPVTTKGMAVTTPTQGIMRSALGADGDNGEVGMGEVAPNGGARREAQAACLRRAANHTASSRSTHWRASAVASSTSPATRMSL